MDNSTEISLIQEVQGRHQNMAINDGSVMFTAAPPSGKVKHTFLLYMIAYILISHIAVSAHTAVVKKFGGVAAVFVGTARKGMTLVLSFLLFPKEANWKYAVGAFLVLGGLTLASLEKQRTKRNRNQEVHKTIDNGNSRIEKVGVQIDPLSISNLPLCSQSSSSNKMDSAKGDCDANERRPFLNMDVELGRTSSVSNGPERRR